VQGSFSGGIALTVVLAVVVVAVALSVPEPLAGRTGAER